MPSLSGESTRARQQAVLGIQAENTQALLVLSQAIAANQLLRLEEQMLEDVLKHLDTEAKIQTRRVYRKWCQCCGRLSYTETHHGWQCLNKKCSNKITDSVTRRK